MNQVLAIVWVALRRLRTQRGLALATTTGLLIAIALTMSIPLYADATLFRLLREHLYQEVPPGAQTPLVFVFNFKGTSRINPQWQDTRPVDEYMSFAAPASLHLPMLSITRYAQTDSFKLFPPYDPQQPQSQYFLDWAFLTYFEPLQEQINLVEGEFPASATAQAEIVPVLVNAEFAFEFAVSPGDIYYARRDNGLEIPVLVSGLWEPRQRSSPLWDLDYKQWLIAPQATYVERITPLIEDDWREAVWYWELDGSGLHAGDIEKLVERFGSIQERLEILRPGARLVLSLSKSYKSTRQLLRL